MEKRQKMENQEVGYTTKDWMLRFVKECLSVQDLSCQESAVVH